MRARSASCAPWRSTRPVSAASASRTRSWATRSCSASPRSWWNASKRRGCGCSTSMASSPVAEGTRAAGAMVPVPYRVARRRRETHDSWTLELEPHGEAAVAPLAPGQFAMLYAFGKGEVPISVSALPLVHTIRAVGVVSAALCEARRGDVLGVRGPFGTAWPVGAAEGADVVVLCGGIGLAPLRPVVHHLLAHRERYGNVAVLYGGR